MNLNRHVEAKEAVDPVVDLALELNYQRSLPSIYITLGSYSFIIEEEYHEACDYLNNAVKIATEIGDVLSLWFAYSFLGMNLSHICEFEKSLDNFQRSLDIAVAANNPIGISNAKSTRCIGAYILRGEIDLAFRESKDSLRMAEESGDMRNIGIAHYAYGNSCYHKRMYDEAEQNLLKAVSICEKITHFEWVVFALMTLGEIYFDNEEYGKAIDCFDKAISTLKYIRRHPSYIYAAKISKKRAEVFIKMQNIDISELVKFYNKINPAYFHGQMARHISEILLNMDDQHVSEAEEWIKKAITKDKRNGMMWHLGQDYALYAELFKRKGDQPKAKENLNKAIEILKECGADGWVEKYEKELTDL